VGKRSSFERREAFYPTPAKAVAPRHLEDFGLRCAYKGDICAGSDSSEMFRYVRHADVPRFTAEGSELLPALDGTHQVSIRR
jgi:hypothetical protein